MDEKINELLEELRKLDPEAWNCYQHRLEPLRDTPCDIPRGKIIMWAILEGVLQDAIAADDRFLGFEVRFTSYFDVKYEATIFWDGTGSISVSGYGETAADAILAAYIAAREAELEAGR